MASRLRMHGAMTVECIEALVDADVTDSEVVAVIVSCASRGRVPRAPAWAEQLLEVVGGVGGLARADAAEIEALLGGLRVPRAGPAAGALAAAFELGRRAVEAEARLPEMLADSACVAAWAQPRLGRLVHEELWLVALDGRSRLRAARRLAKGGLHGLGVRPPDVLRAAVRVGAAAFVLVHNHPSGDPTPSREDVVFTAAIAAAARAVGVPLLDHVVVAGGAFDVVPGADA